MFEANYLDWNTSDQIDSRVPGWWRELNVKGGTNFLFVLFVLFWHSSATATVFKSNKKGRHALESRVTVTSHATNNAPWHSHWSKPHPYAVQFLVVVLFFVKIGTQNRCAVLYRILNYLYNCRRSGSPGCMTVDTPLNLFHRCFDLKREA